MSFFDESKPYHNFGILHWLPIGILFLFFLCIIVWIKKKAPIDQKWNLIYYLSLVPALAVILRMILIAYEGKFTLKEDLPLHLCRVLALILPIAIYYKNKKWINILYFFIMVGTIQALLTPELSHGPPHYGYFIYFLLHVFLFCIPIYIITELNIIPSKKDLINAFSYGNIYLIITLCVNFLLESNYFYTRHKPKSASLLDILGPWPWYIITVEILTLILFIIAWLPFKNRNKNQEK
ncbi:MAG: hypothetical protein RLZZ546_287 [Bacteroidota bacterium]